MSKATIGHEISRIDREIIELLSKRDSLVRKASAPDMGKQAARNGRRVNASAQKVKQSAGREGIAPDAATNVYFPDI